MGCSIAQLASADGALHDVGGAAKIPRRLLSINESFAFKFESGAFRKINRLGVAHRDG